MPRLPAGILAAVAATSAFHAGCCSISSVLLERSPQTRQFEGHKLRGYPLALKVPTHIKVDVVSRTYLNPDDGSVLRSGPKPTDAAVVTYNFRTQIIETEKMFTLDYARPASGTLDHRTQFTPDGYLASVAYASNDDTITQVSAAIQRAVTNITTGGTVADIPVASPLTLLTGADTATPVARKDTFPSPVLGKTKDGLSDAQTDPDLSKYQIIDNVVASRMFELDDPNLQTEISSFVESYSHTCRW